MSFQLVHALDIPVITIHLINLRLLDFASEKSFLDLNISRLRIFLLTFFLFFIIPQTKQEIHPIMAPTIVKLPFVAGPAPAGWKATSGSAQVSGKCR
jgi:hypothetical protein